MSKRKFVPQSNRSAQPSHQTPHPIGAVIQGKIEFRSPLPPPAVLDQYERVLPGSAREIVDLLKARSEHREKMERTAAIAFSRGQWLGALVVLVMTGATIWAIMLGAPTVATIIAGAIALTATSFIKNRISKKE